MGSVTSGGTIKIAEAQKIDDKITDLCPAKIDDDCCKQAAAFWTQAKGYHDRATAAKTAVEHHRKYQLPHDPPINSLSHSVQFVVALTGSVNPNWLLVAFKGPGTTGPLVSGSHTATHTLNIVMGSPSALSGRELDSSII